MSDKKIVELPTLIRIGFPELTKPEIALLSMQYCLRKESHRLIRKLTYSGNPPQSSYNYEIIVKADQEQSTEAANSHSKRTVSLDSKSIPANFQTKTSNENRETNRISSVQPQKKASHEKPTPKAKMNKKAKQSKVVKEIERSAQSQEIVMSNSDSFSAMSPQKPANR